VTAPKIDVRHVSKTFHRYRGKVDSPVAALRDVTLQVQSGEFVCLVGPSGCGKTTLLRLMHGLLEPDEGQVVLDGERPATPGPHAGFVFQSFRLLPWRTVLDNVEFPLQIQDVAKDERMKRARNYLRLVGLEDFEHSYPHELSGGMQQRVGLARALALEPEI
jgi:NitT/TauT family transport system ATP-binding protein